MKQLTLFGEEEKTMKTIWKYELYPTTRLELPKESKLLKIDIQYDKPCLWFLLDPSNEKEYRMFVTYGTGHDVPDEPGQYVGTFFMNGGSLVFHVFETTSESHRV